jgi:hypothetical protein
VTAASRIGVALLVADELRRARQDLETHDLNVRLRRVERDEAWRAEQLELIADLQDLVDRACRFRKDPA